MITLTTEQAQQIEEALVNLCNSIQLPTSDVKALATIRAARAQEQAEQEPVGVVETSDEWGVAGVVAAGTSVGTKLYAAPVRTKDLTNDELQPFLDEWWNLPCDTAHDVKKIFRAVIAADRSKNK